MARRLQLHEKFCELLGTRNVYFQPPPSVQLKYDCIVYKVANRRDLKADDRQYRHLVCYEVTYIYRDPDSSLSEEILDSFTYVSHSNYFTNDNLHHDVYRIYY